MFLSSFSDELTKLANPKMRAEAQRMASTLLSGAENRGLAQRAKPMRQQAAAMAKKVIPAGGQLAQANHLKSPQQQATAMAKKVLPPQGSALATRKPIAPASPRPQGNSTMKPPSTMARGNTFNPFGRIGR